MALKPMRAGMFDRRVTLLKPTTTVDAFGGTNTTWATVATVWAWYDPRRGSEHVRADREDDVNKMTLQIRYRQDIKNFWRVRYNGFDYIITSIEEISRRTVLRLSCEATVD